MFLWVSRGADSLVVQWEISKPNMLRYLSSHVPRKPLIPLIRTIFSPTFLIFITDNYFIAANSHKRLSL